MSKGLFITFEGPDGSGKTTQIEMLKKFLAEKGYEAILTREPGGTAISEKIREIILDKNNMEMDYRTEALLYAASRAQHVAEVIKPAVESGKTVICDRFMDSSIVYQGFGRKLGDDVRIINEFAVQGILPDITFLLKVDPEIGKHRIKAEEQDRLELEKLEYHMEVFQAYQNLEKQNPNRIIGIDASGTIHEISEKIKAHMERIIL
ncbi:dTMP kinase [Sinanaerobacter chloroacetimidivorans]|jgi:dTMP kinase|uniref:Thymidylate kinase n=1 Tax=Sinanaerobacter chloroacetimidivorans TaxID=2818044 RepID=A0A8J7W437_9FIRM|nr:dTMP kinase [Sinanaerobacter chloroacetimidivorans]MBR0600567.1 dTMP kinase [Sinanaerobacter chloroacetimidivorans]